MDWDNVGFTTERCQRACSVKTGLKAMLYVKSTSQSFRFFLHVCINFMYVSFNSILQYCPSTVLKFVHLKKQYQFHLSLLVLKETAEY